MANKSIKTCPASWITRQIHKKYHNAILRSAKIPNVDDNAEMWETTGLNFPFLLHSQLLLWNQVVPRTKGGVPFPLLTLWLAWWLALATGMLATLMVAEALKRCVQSVWLSHASVITTGRISPCWCPDRSEMRRTWNRFRSTLLQCEAETTHRYNEENMWLLCLATEFELAYLASSLWR